MSDINNAKDKHLERALGHILDASRTFKNALLSFHCWNLFSSLPETRSTYDKQVSVDVDWLPPVEVVSLYGVTAIFWQEISSDLCYAFVQCVT